jgi:hypothetical protein
MKTSITLENEDGESLAVNLSPEGDREVGKLMIDGVPYHVERIKAAVLKSDYRVDRDVGYIPQQDKNGLCIIIAPYDKE